MTFERQILATHPVALFHGRGGAGGPLGCWGSMGGSFYGASGAFWRLSGRPGRQRSDSLILCERQVLLDFRPLGVPV